MRELQNYPPDRFSGDFAEISYLMQIHILLCVGGLHQTLQIANEFGIIRDKTPTSMANYDYEIYSKSIKGT